MWSKPINASLEFGFVRYIFCEGSKGVEPNKIVYRLNNELCSHQRAQINEYENSLQ